MKNDDKLGVIGENLCGRKGKKNLSKETFLNAINAQWEISYKMVQLWNPQSIMIKSQTNFLDLESWLYRSCINRIHTYAKFILASKIVHFVFFLICIFADFFVIFWHLWQVWQLFTTREHYHVFYMFVLSQYVSTQRVKCTPWMEISPRSIMKIPSVLKTLHTWCHQSFPFPSLFGK